MDRLKKKIEIPGKALRYPHKTTINMVTCGAERNVRRTLIAGIAAIVVLVLVVVKVGVYDQFDRLNEAEQGYQGLHQKNQALQERLEDYNQVYLEYLAYSNQLILEEEDSGEKVLCVDRQEALQLIDGEMASRGRIQSVEIYENEAKVAMSGMGLNEVSAMLLAVEASPIVKDAQLKVAETTESRNVSDAEFYITILLTAEKGGAGE